MQNYTGNITAYICEWPLGLQLFSFKLLKIAWVKT